MPESSRSPRSFLSLLSKSFSATQGPLIAAIALLVGLASWFFKPPPPVPFPLVLGGALVALLACLTLFHASYTAFQLMKHPLPTIRAARKPSFQQAGIEAICFLEPSDLFSHDSLVSFYVLEDSQFEVLIGVGHVLTLQENGLIQVALSWFVPGYETLLEQLWNNDNTLLKRLIVKPTVPRINFPMGGNAQ